MTMHPKPEAARWASKIVGHGKVDPKSLAAHPLNWRVHPKNQTTALDAAIDDVGFWRSVNVNRNSGVVIDGHLRVARALATGQAEIDVEWVDFTADEERKALASADSIAGMATVDRTKLDDLLRGIQSASTGMQDFLAAFAKQSGLYLNTLKPAEDVGPKLERALELRQKWGTAVGQLWTIPSMTRLGKTHRLLIDDSTVAANVRRVLDGRKADLIFTDPPYGVAYVGKTKDALTIQNDQQDDVATRQLVRDALLAWQLKPGGAWYICAPAGHTETAFRLAIIEAKHELRETLVWVKQSLVLGKQDYHWRHESILYGWAPGAAHYFIEQRIHDTILLDEEGKEVHTLSKAELIERLRALYRHLQEDVWREPRPTTSPLHPTTKPVELPRKAIRNSSRLDEIVFDGFVGAGAMLVAAEQEGRQGRAMEIEPKYAAVTLQRLADLGLEPLLEAAAEAAPAAETEVPV